MVAEDLAKPAQVQNSGTDGAEPGPPSAPVVKAATAIKTSISFSPIPNPFPRNCAMSRRARNLIRECDGSGSEKLKHHDRGGLAKSLRAVTTIANDDSFKEEIDQTACCRRLCEGTCA
jgi:hypothetical protein